VIADHGKVADDLARCGGKNVVGARGKTILEHLDRQCPRPHPCAQRHAGIRRATLAADGQHARLGFLGSEQRQRTLIRLDRDAADIMELAVVQIDLGTGFCERQRRRQCGNKKRREAGSHVHGKCREKMELETATGSAGIL